MTDCHHLVVGLDVSTSSTGVADAAGRCSTVAPKSAPGPSRLDELFHGVTRAVRRGGGADVAAVEGYSLGGLRGLAAARLAEAGGIVRWALWRHGVAIVEVPPSTLKLYAVGTGGAKASKEAMLAAADDFGADVANHDEADAFLLRACVLHLLGYPIVDPARLPDRHVEAIATLTERYGRQLGQLLRRQHVGVPS